MSEIAEFYRSNDLDSEMVFITADEFDQFRGIDKIHYLQFDPYHAYYYPIYQDVVLEDRNLLKKFLCLNKRGMVHRQLLYRAFYHYGLLESSYFSYLCERITQHDYILFDEHTWGVVENGIKQIRPTQWPELQSMAIPPEKFIQLPNDQRINEYQPWTKNGDWALGQTDPTWLTDLELFHNSFCSVIIETAPDSPVVNLSEKTIRSIACGHPTLVLGAKGTVRRLRDLGFDMLDDIFDNSYDVLDDDIQRLAAFVKSIQRINAYSFSDLTDLKKSLRPRLQNNRDNLRNLYSKIPGREKEITRWIMDYFKLPLGV